jgi:hypothetical protein
MLRQTQLLWGLTISVMETEIRLAPVKPSLNRLRHDVKCRRDNTLIPHLRKNDVSPPDKPPSRKLFRKPVRTQSFTASKTLKAWPQLLYIGRTGGSYCFVSRTRTDARG